MIFNGKVGIVSFGGYFPSYAISGQEIALAQDKPNQGIPESLGVAQKTVPAIDEDAITMAVEAANLAINRAKNCSRQQISSLFMGSESHPYAVKSSTTILAAALGLGGQIAAADLQFACKAGTQAMQIVAQYAQNDVSHLGLAIGADTAQGKPGDVLEFTAGAGAAAILLGSKNVVAILKASVSVLSDTPDFWRRPGQRYPEHAGRFSGEPGYFAHVAQATRLILKETNLNPTNIDWCVFHSPNAKFPQALANQLGFTNDQLKHSLLVKSIGNTYAAASLLSLVNVLEHAKPNQRILVTSYGSGSGADSFILETTPLLATYYIERKMMLIDRINELNQISYREYRRYTNTI